MRKRLIIALLTLSLLTPQFSQAATVSQLKSSLTAQQRKAAELRKQIQAYNAALAKKRAESANLKQQIGSLNGKISTTQKKIGEKNATINKSVTETNAVQKTIEQKEQEMDARQDEIAETLRTINTVDQQSLLKSLIIEGSISKFFAQSDYLGTLQGKLQGNLNEVQALKQNLEQHKKKLVTYTIALTNDKERLQNVKEDLRDQEEVKADMLTQTKASEAEYQKLLRQLQSQQSAANNEIMAIERQIQSMLTKPTRSNGGTALQDRLKSFGKVVFSWPVNPYRGISTRFRDPNYPFRRLFEHPGIDIPEPQGTALKAAADGYVAIAKDAGMGYSYILIQHNEGFSTVYGHVSAIYVRSGQYVSRGQLIGRTGAKRGTPGAGPLTTGPHLHLELRKNGVPVDPLKYLP